MGKITGTIDALLMLAIAGSNETIIVAQQQFKAGDAAGQGEQQKAIICCPGSDEDNCQHEESGKVAI